jgi:shikimate dehydrogenase
MGHLTRVLGGLRGNAITFAAISPEAGTAPGQPTLDRLRDVYRFADALAGAAVYGVAGNPAIQSRSPELHNAAFARLGRSAMYLPLECEALRPVVDWMRDGGLAGLSVTAPFKGDALALADDVSERALVTGAANTLWMEGARLQADNTDVIAAEALLREMAPRGSVAVLGAGGAAAAILAAARGLGLSATVFNRDPSRGHLLAARLGAKTGGGLERFDPRGFAAVVNTTPPGSFEPEGDPARFSWDGIAILDVTYAAGPTAWEILARNHGLKFGGGLRFLAEQAVGQCLRWTGTSVPVADFLEVLQA